MQSDTTIVSIPTVFVSIVAVILIAAAIIIATHGQKSLPWQLRNVILSGMYNCNFEAINYVLNKRMRKLKMEYKPFTCIIIFSWHSL